MKKIIATLTLSITTTASFSQSQNWWRTNGNSPTGTEVFGTTNAQPLNIVTNNVLKMVLDANGNLRLVNFAGSGNRIVTTDANGNLLALPQGTTGQFLSSNGTWQNLPAVPTQLWSTSGNSIYYPTGNVGIGAVPNTAYRLDVAGDARIQNNLYVGGGILISQKVEATNSLKTDTVFSASGSTKFTSNVVLKNQLQVDGPTLFNGNAVFSSQISSPQGINVGNSTTFRSYVSPTPNVGNIISLGAPPIGGGGNDPAPCVVGGTTGWLNNGTNGLYSYKTVSGNTSWFTQYVNATNGNSYIDASGSINGSTPAALYINQNCNSSTYINKAGGNLLTGDNVFMNKNVDIGTTTNNSGYLKVYGSTDAFISTVNNRAFAVIDNSTSGGGNFSFKVLGDGRTQIITNSTSDAFNITNATNSQVNFKVNKTGVTQIGSTSGVAAFLNVKGDVNTTSTCFETNHNADYGYNTKVVVNRNLTKAFAVFNTATGPAIESFRVYGNGQTQIGIKSQNTIHSDALLNVYGKMVSTSCYIRTTDWADYVFAKDYKLPNLYDVEKYYIANKHLPEIPSEKEVLENGIDVAEMNKLLLKKIEEMTILMVKQQKQIDALEVKIK